MNDPDNLRRIIEHIRLAHEELLSDFDRLDAMDKDRQVMPMPQQIDHEDFLP